MEDELDPVFKALADVTRRRILDLLKGRARTTGQLCEQFPDLSRFGVMKHLGVLEAAGLVLVERKGRERYNHLNSIPIRRIYERWMGPYAELWSSQLLRLKDFVERERPKPPRD
jgi:DNA-binding transcriptional ArsR family regulator